MMSIYLFLYPTSDRGPVALLPPRSGGCSKSMDMRTNKFFQWRFRAFAFLAKGFYRFRMWLESLQDSLDALVNRHDEGFDSSD